MRRGPGPKTMRAERQRRCPDESWFHFGQRYQRRYFPDGRRLRFRPGPEAFLGVDDETGPQESSADGPELHAGTDTGSQDTGRHRRGFQAPRKISGHAHSQREQATQGVAKIKADAEGYRRGRVDAPSLRSRGRMHKARPLREPDADLS